MPQSITLNLDEHGVRMATFNLAVQNYSLLRTIIELQRPGVLENAPEEKQEFENWAAGIQREHLQFALRQIVGDWGNLPPLPSGVSSD